MRYRTNTGMAPSETSNLHFETLIVLMLSRPLEKETLSSDVTYACAHRGVRKSTSAIFPASLDTVLSTLSIRHNSLAVNMFEVKSPAMSSAGLNTYRTIYRCYLYQIWQRVQNSKLVSISATRVKLSIACRAFSHYDIVFIHNKQ